jgi:hypothetical protein
MADDPELVGARLADALKQLAPSLPVYAKLSRDYYNELVGQGFDQKDALFLTAKFIETIIFGKHK